MMIDATSTTAIPSELRARDQWVAWRSEERHGSRTKVPYTPTSQPGRRASTTDVATWGSFDQAVAATSWSDGIGFVFSPDDPYCGVDLDHCIAEDGEVHPDAAALVAWLDSYAEISPSGTGLHVIVRGEVLGDRRRTAHTPWGDELETYDTGRYFCFTGNVIPGLAVNGAPPLRQDTPTPTWWTPDQPLRYDTIAYAQDALDAMVEQYFGTDEAAEDAPAQARDGSSPPERDDAIIDKAHGAINGEAFARLWGGDVSGYGSASEADLALVSKLAFYTGPDRDALDRLYRRSGLVREKWDRADYRERTLKRAIARDEFYDWSSATTGEWQGEDANEDASSSTPPDMSSVGRSARELRDTVAPDPDWLIPGVIAKGWMVKLAGREKVGKGTLIAYLLGRLERGKPTVFGSTPEPVTSLIYTEEPQDTLRGKVHAVGLEQATIVFHWELRSLKSWSEVARWLVARALEEGHGLIYLDNVSRATGTEEEAGTELARKCELLSTLAKTHAIAVLVDHHHRKSGGKIEDLSRGGTALAGASENNIEIVRRGDWETRARTLYSAGRHSATRWEREVELSEDGSDYTVPDAEPYRDQVLGQRELWTVKEFAEEIERGRDAARRWLDENAERVEQDSGGPTRYRARQKLADAKVTDAPTID